MGLEERMNEQILQRIDALAAKLGTTAQYLWGVLIRQARIEVIENIICIAVFVAFGYAMFRVCAKYAHAWEDCDNFPEAMASVFSGIAVVICMIVVAVAFCSIWTPLLNPEFWALKQVLGAAK